MQDTEKQCNRCKLVYPREHFFRYNRTSGLCELCEKDRQKIKQRQAYRKNIPLSQTKSSVRYRQNKEKIQKRRRELFYGYRQTVLNHYCQNDPRCVCCGEKEDLFLTIDHINNDGHKHRVTGFTSKSGRRQSNGQWVYKQIINENFPTDIQILCYNCNCGKARNGGVCPHKKN